jgi:hypothetical protein
MNTFSSTNIIQKNIITKPYLLTTEELAEIGSGINLVGYDFLKTLPTPIDETIVNFRYGNPSSPRLLNWVEPYTIAGVRYTLFYTEVNSGLKVGDKVFIINGAYDSNLLIQQDKYKKGRDGYKVLFVDECRIVLDIEFVGWLPANETSENQEDFDEFIKVYYIKDQNDFIHVNRQVTTRDGSFDYKFNKNQNNIIFTDKLNGFAPVSDWGETSGLTGSPGFFIKNGTSNWINISNDFMLGSYSIATAGGANDKILILNGSFTHSYSNGVFTEFKEDSVYSWKYDSISGTYSWLVNVKHENNNPPIITKSNFRKGEFDGKWNGGLYGTSDERIIWNSKTATWNSGTLLNTIWQTGIMNSFYSQPSSYFSEFDYSFATSSAPYGLPYQKVNNPDNNGYGYNFVINSDIQNAVINNGNVTNSKLGASASSYQIVEEYLKTGTIDLSKFSATSSIVVNKALFDNCKFINANIENTEIRNCRAENSRFNKVKSVNSHYKSSLFLNSNYISDNIIKVLDYDEFTYTITNNSNVTHKVYKFYINKRSYEKFKLKDSFYIRGIRINNNSGELLNFFDTKFKIGPYKEYIDFNLGDGFRKLGVEYNAFVSTPKENEYRYSVDNTGNKLEDIKGKDYYSVDIFVKQKFEQSTITYTKDFNNTFLGTGILDFSEAYIVNSDFESGIFENSNWNSGNHINYSNDNNITKDILNGGGFYSLTGTNSISFSNTISSEGIASEVDYDYLGTGSVVFLNAVDYDTRGKVTSFVIDNPGSLYTNGTFSTSGGSGTGLTINVNASTIGAAFEIELIPDGNNNNYYYASSAGGGYTTRQTTGGSGTGLVVEITVSNNSPYFITSATILNPGSGYNINDELNISLVSTGGINNEGPVKKLKITSILNGGVLVSSTQSFQGLGYQINDIITINSGNSDAKIRVTGITGSLTRLPDAYKIVDRRISGTNQEIDLESINTFPNLLEDGLFLTMGAQNKYGYLHRTKFSKSRLITGIFKRAYITNSLLRDESFDVSDKDFNNIKKIKNLIFVDTIFSDNSNILSKATYMNSFFVGGNDIWDNGIIYDSIWNGGNFKNGLVKESIWVDGIFSDGLFYNSRSFNDLLGVDYNENVKTRYYKSGTESNARFSWQNGTFLNGEFYKSDWENGVFNGGKFYYSKFYNGIFNNGVIGDRSIPIDDTWFYNGTINYAVVENSKIVSQKYNGISNSVITWNNGIFNSGVFGTNDTQMVTLTNPGGGTTTSFVVNTATWSYGIFNGGEFRNKAKWKDGIFNGGKFLSNYGLNLPDNSLQPKEDYSWEYGIFNGGEFGNANTTINSNWYDGEFNGGQFKGRVWNNGIFSFGEFLGSGGIAIGGIPSIISQSNPGKFVNSYNFPPFGSIRRYYGLWRNGYVTDIKDKYITDKKLYTDIKRSSDTTKVVNKAILKNMLWEKGIFSHPGGEMSNSVWLDGTFESGRFLSSSFNPYVTRNNVNTFNFSNTCYWKNGIFDGGEFNISTWENGTFVSGTAVGMNWKNGIVNYMNAYNVFWEDGLWRNGNWNGSYFNLTRTGSVIDNYTLQILNNGMSISGTSSLHVWNIFHDESLSDYAQSNTDTTRVVFSASNNDAIPAWGSTSSFSEVNSGGNTNNPIITLTNVYTQESPTIQDIMFYFTWTTSGFSNISSIDAEWKSSSEAMWVNGSNIPLVSPNTETLGDTSFQQGSPQQADYPIDVRLSAYENGSTNPVFSNVFVVNQQTPFFRIQYVGSSNSGGPFKIFGGPPNSQVTLTLDSSTQDTGTWILLVNGSNVGISGNIPINSPAYYADLDSNGESDELLISTGGGQMSGSLLIIVSECINPNTQQQYLLPQSPYDRLSQQL